VLHWHDIRKCTTHIRSAVHHRYDEHMRDGPTMQLQSREYQYTCDQESDNSATQFAVGLASVVVVAVADVA
jgi:hypothetical protein